jgi:hypothetical protein
VNIDNVPLKKTRTVKAINRIAEGTNCNAGSCGDEFRAPMTSIADSDMRRAEHLRPVARKGENWMSLYGQQNATESVH